MGTVNKDNNKSWGWSITINKSPIKVVNTYLHFVFKTEYGLVSYLNGEKLYTHVLTSYLSIRFKK